MPDLKIAVGTTGPVPDNQCALKDAVLVATAAGITSPTQIVELARAFHEFLTQPAGVTEGAIPTGAVAPPAPPATPDVMPPQPAIGEPVVATPGGDNATPAPAGPPTVEAPADVPAPGADDVTPTEPSA